MCCTHAGHQPPTPTPRVFTPTLPALSSRVSQVLGASAGADSLSQVRAQLSVGGQGVVSA